MLYAYSILLTGNEILAKMFHFLMTILMCFAIYSFGKKYFIKNETSDFLADSICYNASILAKEIKAKGIITFTRFSKNPKKPKRTLMELRDLTLGKRSDFGKPIATFSPT